MVTTDFAHDIEQMAESARERRAFEYSRLALVLLCAIVGLVAGYVGGGMGHDMSVATLSGYLAIAFVAFLVAAGLLRLIDVLVLRTTVSVQRGRSAMLSSELRARLESRDPEIANKARNINAEALIDRALHYDRNKAPSLF